MKKKLAGVALVLAAVSLMSVQPVEACTRAVYIGPDQMVITGRTMDWKEDIMTNIYVHQDLHEMNLYPCAYFHVESSVWDMIRKKR